MTRLHTTPRSRRPDALAPITLLKAGVDAADVAWVANLPESTRRETVASTFRGQAIVQRVWAHFCAPKGQTVGANPVPA